ncbi:MAG: hypothetical protein GY828_08310 [Candidatus Gracilibacteria bacterium]|nr:hypothetical protein [Candidatus Gracilibacteria bacterium]
MFDFAENHNHFAQTSCNLLEFKHIPEYIKAINAIHFKIVVYRNRDSEKGLISSKTDQKIELISRKKYKKHINQIHEPIKKSNLDNLPFLEKNIHKISLNIFTIY